MKRDYMPSDRNGRLFHVIEECGEVLHALGKAGRFGMGSRHPARRAGELNAEQILRELHDLKLAIVALEPDLRAEVAKIKANR
jgi:hypothetical protein